MPQDKSLSISFGDFACDIVGYDKPFTILNQVVDLFAKVAEATAASARDADETSSSAESFESHLMRQAAAFDLNVEQREGRFIVSNPHAPAQTCLDEIAEDQVENVAPPADAKAARPRLRLSPILAADPEALVAPAAEKIAAVEVASTATEPEPVPEPVADEQAAPADIFGEEVSAEALEDAVAAEAAKDQPEADQTLEPFVLKAPSFAEAAGVAVATTSLEKEADEHAAENIAASIDAQAEEPVEALDAVEPLQLAEAEVAAPAVEDSIFIDDDEIEEAIAADGEAADLENEIFASFSEPTENEAETSEGAESVVETAEVEDDVLDLAEIAAGDEAPSADVEASPGAVDAEEAPRPARLKPRIVINRDASRGHRRARAQVAGEHRGLLELTSALRAEPAPKTGAPTALHEEDDDHDNFLFAEEDDHAPAEAPTTETLALQPSEAAPVAGESVEDEAPKAARKGLSLGIFKRFAQRDDSDAEDASSDEDSGFNRLKETADAALPRLEETSNEAPRKLDAEPAIFAISDAADFDEEQSPAAFARRVGASSLQDLLESSAAFMSIVEGKAKFSRRDVMQALAAIGVEKDYTQEARLKSFRKLLTNGAIVRSDDGLFAISHATRFGYETRLRG